jgi:hypothetical protein
MAKRTEHVILAIEYDDEKIELDWVVQGLSGIYQSHPVAGALDYLGDVVVTSVEAFPIEIANINTRYKPSMKRGEWGVENTPYGNTQWYPLWAIHYWHRHRLQGYGRLGNERWVVFDLTPEERAKFPGLRSDRVAVRPVIGTTHLELWRG